MSAGRYLNPWGDPDDAPTMMRTWAALALFAAVQLAIAAMGIAWWLMAASADH